MADLADVESVLVSAITQIAYPDGTASPSIADATCKVHRGWPIPAQLERDLKAGRLTVSVYPAPAEKRTTRYARDWLPLPVPAKSLAIAATEGGITISGTPASPLNAAAVVNGTAHIYPVQPGDTLNSIATGLAALIARTTPATSSGASISIPGAFRLEARIGGVGTLIREIRRQKRQFQLTCWCPSPETRDDIAGAIDLALADIDYLALPDGSAGRLLYERSHVMDGSQAEGLYRRDLFYSVEYATTQVQGATQIVAIPIDAGDFDGNRVPPDTHPAALLLETGAYILLEDGGRLLLDIAVAAAPALTLESGGYLLAEDGGRLLLEVNDSEPSLKTEFGSYLLLEGGGRILLSSSAEPGGGIALEDGSLLGTEDGNYIILEG